MIKNNNEGNSTYNSSSNGYNESYNSYGNNSVIYAEIRGLIQNRNISLAERKLNEIRDRNAEWYYLYGRIMLAKGWFESAYNNIQRACKMDPNNFEYRQNLNNLRMRARSYTNTYRTTGGNANAFDCCINLWCLDSICECMGGDLIGCC